MDLFIHTLTGTVFELRVSPFETILSIKAKVQRLEGIPISQQHLIWRSTELEDDYCLHDYGIRNGATLTLVLAMRDGPINMRRVSVEEPTMQEMADCMDANREEIWDKLMNDDKQVTLLVFRDGDQLNFFRVYDRGDGTLSPYSETLSPVSNYNACPDNEIGEIKQADNLVTRDKMKLLRQQIDAKADKKKNIEPRPPSTGKPSTNFSKRRIHFSQPPRSVLSRHGVIPKTESKLKQYDEVTPSPEKLEGTSITHDTPITHDHLPRVRSRGKDSANVDVTDFTSDRFDDQGTVCSFQSNVAECNTDFSFCISEQGTVYSQNRYKCLPNLQTSTNKPHINNNIADENKAALRKSSRSRRQVLKPLGTVDRSNASELFSDIKSPPHDKRMKNKKSVHRTKDETERNERLDEVLKESQLPELLRSPTEYENYKKLLNWVHPKSNEVENEPGGKRYSISRKNSFEMIRSLSRSRRKTPDGRISMKVHSSKIHPHGNLTHLPPVHQEKRDPPTLNGRKKTRCSLCGKKLGLATTYQCRCGSKFCASHRYPETHTCTYDYKTEGRKFLAKNNPVVAAPKLPKI